MQGQSLIFEHCDQLTLLLDARTNYLPDYRANWRTTDPLPRIQKELDAAVLVQPAKLLAHHMTDVNGLMSAAAIHIGVTQDSIMALPTDARLGRYASGGADPGLEELLFQYGRYLLVSSSRPGGLPANLQGLWNNSNNPPWASDYHNNINIQMNYWGAESTNLSDCHLPLVDFILDAREPCRIATRKAFGDSTRGWTARTSQSIFGGNGWEWNIPASAWYAHHIYEHWAFTNDSAFLADTVLPVLREICAFWEDRLKVRADSTLVVPMGWSPEHGPREDGTMYDQQIVWDLFQNFLDATAAAHSDEQLRQRVAGMQRRLAPNLVGKWGQLQEWKEDMDDPNDHHRHTSHLFAVYPGREISPAKTPELARAAIISLGARSGILPGDSTGAFTPASTTGDSRRSWTWPWRCALWARLGDGEKSAVMIRGLLTYNTLPNLFTSHPPFQMDGNFGITGALAEMLIQSQTGVIQLLPAIPKSWAADGSFSGLRARGGFTVDCSWHNGVVTTYHIRSARPGTVRVQVNGEIKEIISEQTGR